MHMLGMWGMPRRVYTYAAETGWGSLNLLGTIGAGVIALSVLVFLYNVGRSLRRGHIAGPNPWDADTLECATASPPPSYNFAHIPVVTSREGLWAYRDHNDNVLPVVTGLRTDRREILVTSLLNAEPETRYELPDDSIWPFLTALSVGVAFIVAVYTPWGVLLGGALALLAALGWAWPTHPHPPGSERVVPEGAR
jgi:cytochrome c oxidase subunit 1